MTILKKSVNIAGHATSISIEEEFWEELQNIATQNKQSIAKLIAKIDTEREPDTNLSSAIRLHILKNLKND